MKMLWEKVSMFGIIVTTPSASGGFPREGDEFIMQLILRAGYNFDEVKHINMLGYSCRYPKYSRLTLLLTPYSMRS
jgi:hypothetical protein